MKIGIVGIGGVGGYLGAKLSHFYESNNDVEVYFIARNNHLNAIKENGLRLISIFEDYITRPTLATNDANECGVMDYLFYCTKSYDIIEGVKTVMPMIGPSTVIIPILNGVDGAEIIRELLPNNLVCDGLAYIVSAIKGYGVIESIADRNNYCFGDGKADTPSLLKIEEICHKAGIDIHYKEDIKYRVWDKFEFISCVASITTAYNITYYDVLNNERYFSEFCNLVDEFDSVGYAKKVLRYYENRKEKLINTVRSLPSVATTSMQRDFWANKNAEVDSLTKYIIDEGLKLGIETPQYQKIYKTMKENIIKLKNKA